jgi:hypothetical protein
LDENPFASKAVFFCKLCRRVQGWLINVIKGLWRETGKRKKYDAIDLSIYSI